MIFSEIYGAYYNAVADIISLALTRNVTARDICRSAEKYAFAESGQAILSAVKEGRWRFLSPDGSTVLKNQPSAPVTLLEKQWLKAVSLDSRIKLFGIDFSYLDGIQPLFTPGDVCVFDKYSDGDPYSDDAYISRFRLILDAVKNKYPLYIEQPSDKRGVIGGAVMPLKIEYSEKDDKFRLICSGEYFKTVNIAKITKCEKLPSDSGFLPPARHVSPKKTVTLELTDGRNALERALTHFANLEKRAERIGGGVYRITLWYDGSDETEMIIRVLSFGPFVRAVQPQSFVDSIKQRLTAQQSWL